MIGSRGGRIRDSGRFNATSRKRINIFFADIEAESKKNLSRGSEKILGQLLNFLLANICMTALMEISAYPEICLSHWEVIMRPCPRWAEKM